MDKKPKTKPSGKNIIQVEHTSIKKGRTKPIPANVTKR